MLLRAEEEHILRSHLKCPKSTHATSGSGNLVTHELAFEYMNWLNLSNGQNPCLLLGQDTQMNNNVGVAKCRLDSMRFSTQRG